MKPRKVLIVDDEHHIRFILEQELKKHGCEVKTAEDGEEAIKLLKSNKYDIMILDLMMPGVSGIEVCEFVKDSPKIQNQPIIILTADHDEKDREKCLLLGVNDYITKPFSPKGLALRINEILEKYITD